MFKNKEGKLESRQNNGCFQQIEIKSTGSYIMDIKYMTSEIINRFNSRLDKHNTYILNLECPN